MTTLYITVMHQLRSDVDRYNFSIDRCFKNVEQANQRIDLLSRSNDNPDAHNVKKTGVDAAEGEPDSL